MKIASVAVRERPAWPHVAIADGLRAIGYEPRFDRPGPDRADICVTWNDYGASRSLAESFRGAGKPHICIENGPMIRPGTRIVQRDGHNADECLLPIGPHSRFDFWERECRPWKKDITDGHVLICGQRGGNYSPQAMPQDWPERVAAALLQHGLTDVRYRPHPERPRTPRLPSSVKTTTICEPLVYDLTDCAMVVVFSSMSAIEALIRGIPCIYSAPQHVASSVMRRDTFMPGRKFFLDPRFENRDRFFERLAWSIWSDDEIARGKAFEHALTGDTDHDRNDRARSDGQS